MKRVRFCVKRRKKGINKHENKKKRTTSVVVVKVQIKKNGDNIENTHTPVEGECVNCALKKNCFHIHFTQRIIPSFISLIQWALSVSLFFVGKALHQQPQFVGSDYDNDDTNKSCLMSETSHRAWFFSLFLVFLLRFFMSFSETIFNSSTFPSVFSKTS